MASLACLNLMLIFSSNLNCKKNSKIDMPIIMLIVRIDLP